MPYQDRQAADEELSDGVEDTLPPAGSRKLILLVVLFALVAGGIATAFALMHSR